MDIVNIIEILPEELLETIRELPWYPKYLHQVSMKQTWKCIQNDGVYPLYPHQTRWVNESIARGECNFREEKGTFLDDVICECQFPNI